MVRGISVVPKPLFDGVFQRDEKNFTPRNDCKLLKNGGRRRAKEKIHPRRENSL
jgi:hypothetical protein